MLGECSHARLYTANGGFVQTAKPSFSPQIQSEARRQYELIAGGTVDLLPADDFLTMLQRSLQQGKPLRVKQGFDPTTPDIHLGHTVGLRKLRQFQECGHLVVLIVGDYTAMVGDPSGKNATRPRLSYDEVMKNAETYQRQFFRVVDREQTEVRFNGEWFRPMQFTDLLQLTSRFTVARLLERDDFTKRFQAGIPIAVHELLYPLMQAYDSVAVNSDIEIGGTDQKFNLLAGRTIQEAYGQPPQAVLTMPLLVGLDGEKKMSKSIGNYIGVTDPPNEMFGKLMSIPDNLILPYAQLAVGYESKALERARQQLTDGSTNPMIVKKELGVRLVDLYHGDGSGEAARDAFERVFTRKELPDEIETLTADQLRAKGLDPHQLPILTLLTSCGLTKSNSEARKLVEAGSVSIGSEKITSPQASLSVPPEQIIKAGKRRFLRLIP